MNENLTMYDRYVQKKLPMNILKNIQGRQEFAHSQDEKMFLAGFITALRLKEIYKAEGLEWDGR